MLYSISHLFAVLTCEILSSTWEDKICIHKEAYSVYYVNNKIKEILAISPKFLKIFEILRRQSEAHMNSLLIIFQKFPKVSKDYQRLLNISEQFSKMFQSYRIKFTRFIQQLKGPNLVAHMMLLISSHRSKDIILIVSFTCEGIMLSHWDKSL